MRLRRYALLILSMAVFVSASSAPSSSMPHERSGFFLGFGLGVGNAAWTWGFESDDDPSEVSGVAQLRIGGALRDDVVLGLEVSMWAKEYDLDVGGLDLGDAKTSFSAAVAAATWFPGNRGFFVRGGVGVATARAEVDFDLPGIEFLGVDETDRGFAALAAIGYEWRLTKKFALGPELEVFYLGVDGDVADQVIVVNGAMEFNWYW